MGRHPQIKKIETKEANLTIEELGELAEGIRLILTGGKAYTVKEYAKLVKEVRPIDLGYRRTRAIKYEHRLVAYFPDDVFRALDKIKLSNIFNKDDKQFMKKNYHKGIKWLAIHFYTEEERIEKEAGKLELDK